jgi:hypothetical protein
LTTDDSEVNENWSASSVVNAIRALVELQSVLRESRDMALRELEQARQREAMMAEETRRLRARLAHYEQAELQRELTNGAG